MSRRSCRDLVLRGLTLLLLAAVGPAFAQDPIGIWISPEELAEMPTEGPLWENLLGEARHPTGTPDISDQEDLVNARVFAKALVYSRTGDQRFRQDVIEAVKTITFGHTQLEGDTLALGRELGTYVVAADLVGLPTSLDDDFRVFLANVRTEVLSTRTMISTNEDRPNNWGNMSGATRAAIALYLNEPDELEACFQIFIGWLGDREAYSDFVYGDDLSWHADPQNPVGINPVGATIQGHSVDGAQPEAMRRGGPFEWPPPETTYPWESIQAAVSLAHILERAGYEVFYREDVALRRAVRFVYEQGWEADGDDIWLLPLIDHYYATSYWDGSPTRPGKNYGWTGYTHGDCVGDACGSDPLLRVSSDPGDVPDVMTIQEAVYAATESGTRIEILPGNGSPYAGAIVNTGLVYEFTGPSGATVVVDGSAGPAFDVVSSSGTAPMLFRNLELRGQTGIRALVDVDVADVDFRSVAGTALDLDAGSHVVSRVTMDQSVSNGAEVASGAELRLSDSTLLELGGTAFGIDGAATLQTILIAKPGHGIVLGALGQLDLSAATVADAVGVGVDALAGGDVSLRSTVLSGNAAGDLLGVACSAASWSLIADTDCTSSNGNLQTDPMFVDPLASNDYHLQPSSPAVDYGPDPLAFSGQPCSDLDGQPRQLDHDGDDLAVVDIGAYELSNAGRSPGIVDGIAWTGATTLIWSTEPEATEYHVYRSPLSAVGYGLSWTCRDDLDGDRSDTQLSDATVPAPGTGFVYRVTAETVGGSGPLGLGTCSERSNPAPCP